MSFIDRIMTILRPFCEEEVKPKRNQVENKKNINKPEKFVSLYVVGSQFYQYHYAANPQKFVRWLNDNHKEFYSQNKEKLSDYLKLSFYDLIEDIFGHATEEVYQSLADFLYRWFVQEHRTFRFVSFDCQFVSLEDNHLLQVLYRIPDKDILYLKNDTDFCKAFPTPCDYKNNWFIGVDGSNPLLKNFASYLIPGVNKQMAHFKLINEDKANNEPLIDLLTQIGISNYIELTFSNVTTIPNDKVTIARFNRYYKFNNFAKAAKNTFRTLLDQTPKAKRFDDFYMLNVWADDNHPKNDITYVNVAFGSRPLLVSHNHKEFTTTIEEGARLCFYRMEDGFVTVTLYPAKTENRQPNEDGIVLELCVDPEKLSSPKFIGKLWKHFIAYMECTAVDGNPSYCQKRTVNHLRYACSLIKDNDSQPTLKSQRRKNYKDFILTVGCSGIVIFFLQMALDYICPDTTIKYNAKTIVDHIDSTNVELIKEIDSTQLIYKQSCEEILNSLNSLKKREY